MAHQLDPLSLAFLAFAMLLLVSGHMVNGSSNVGDDLVGTLDEVDWEKRPPGADGIDTRRDGEGSSNVGDELGEMLDEVDWEKRQAGADGIDTRRDGEAYPAFVFSGEVRQKNVGGKSSCNGGVVGHKYQSNHPHGHGGTTQSKGRIARMKFTKKRDNTVLRVTFSENIRVIGRGVAVRWFITVDDQECVKPSKLDIVMYQSDPHENSPIPSVLVGICQATAAGQIKKGTHNIDVNIGATSYPLGTPLSGFYSTTFFEVQEVCPEF